MDPMAIIDKYYPSGSALHGILVDHSRQVAEKAWKLPLTSMIRTWTWRLSNRRPCFTTSASSDRIPEIGCTGDAPYLCHGVLAGTSGYEGLDPAFGRVAERHTGAGIRLDTIVRHDLPLPRRDLVPETLAEKIICCADKFFSKTGPARHQPRTISQILADLTAIDPTHALRFSRWAEAFRL